MASNNDIETTIGVNRNVLKYVAIFAMVLDHFAHFFLQPGNSIYYLFRVIGRLTCPVMCFFIVEGFTHTSSKKRYALRLFVFALISQLAYAFSRYQTILIYDDFNFILNLLISFLILWCIEDIKSKWCKTLSVIGLLLLSLLCDWGLYTPLLVIVLYCFRNSKKLQIIAFSMLSILFIGVNVIIDIIKGLAWPAEIMQLGLFLFVPALCLYNGKPGHKNAFNKWFFYIFYPLHLIVFAIFKFYII